MELRVDVEEIQDGQLDVGDVRLRRCGRLWDLEFATKAEILETDVRDNLLPPHPVLS